MKNLILLMLMTSSSAVFSMQNAKVDIGAFETIVSGFHDRSLTCAQVEEFFKSPALEEALKERFASSVDAQAIKDTGKIAAETKDTSLAFYEIETFYAGLLALARCQSDAKEKGEIMSIAYSVLKNSEMKSVTLIDQTLQASVLRTVGEGALQGAVNRIDELQKVLCLQRIELQGRLELIADASKK